MHFFAPHARENAQLNLLRYLTRRQRWTYTLISRLIGGLVLGIMGGLSWGLTLGLLVGFIHAVKFERARAFALRKERRSQWWSHLKGGVAVVIFVLISGVSYGVYQLYDFIDGLLWIVLTLAASDEDVFGKWGFFYVMAVFPIVILSTGLLWGIRTHTRYIWNDIQSVEAIKWSWKKAVLGGGLGFFFAIVPTLGVMDEPNEFLSNWLAVGAVLGLTGFFFWGLSHRTVIKKTVANQGIKRSVRYALLIGPTLGVVSGLMMVVLFTLSGISATGPASRITALYQNLYLGLVWASVIGVSIGLWYGGLDAIQHYTLRFILHHKGYLPWKLVPFLDYVTRLIFLQKVGGGYLFIHRYLLEHFAAMGEASEASETPAQPAEA